MTGQPIARPCGICGARVTDGTSRCHRHKGRAYPLPVSCKTCGRLGPTSYCDQHRPARYGNPHPDEAARLAAQPWRTGYRDPAYHRNRQAAITAAAGHCQACGHAVSPGTFEVDHIVPLSTATTRDDLTALNARDNLRVLCIPCHRMKRRQVTRRPSW